MKSVLLPTAAWPNLHYLFYVANSEHVVIEQHETYPRQTFRNRYEILSANGVLALTVPVKRSGNHTKTKDILIDYSSDWQTRHWRALTSAYRKSPFFEFLEDEFSPFYKSCTERLLDYNTAQLDLVKRLLRLQAAISLNTKFEKEPVHVEDKRRIADNKLAFNTDDGIRKLLEKPYYQTFGDKHGFSPNLSCLDILFNQGLKAADYIRITS